MHKVTLGAEPVPIDQSVLQYSAAPNVPAVYFESLPDPYYRINQSFGDQWLFLYEFKIKKGEYALVNFYKASDDEAKANACDVLIDVRLEKFGTPDEGVAEKLERDYVSADMSSLRTSMADKADYNGNINIKFRFYRSGNQGMYISNKVYVMRIEKGANL